MREFACSSLGYSCSWRHRATEELLTDFVALHLRDAHGVRALDAGMIGVIKNIFSGPATADSGHESVPVMKEYKCNIGHACGWRSTAMTEELIVDGAAIHAREAHGIQEFTPEMIAHVKKSIHELR